MLDTVSHSFALSSCFFYRQSGGRSRFGSSTFWRFHPSHRLQLDGILIGHWAKDDVTIGSIGTNAPYRQPHLNHEDLLRVY